MKFAKIVDLRINIYVVSFGKNPNVATFMCKENRGRVRHGRDRNVKN